MATAARAFLTSEEYLERERKADFRSEYYQGRITAMAGATYDHSLIVTNLIGELRQALRKTAYTVSSSDLRLAVSSSRLYTYPDIMVVCGDPAFVDNRRDTVSNPVLVVEVLSESPKNYDRGEKFQSYRALPSLKEFVAVAQDKLQVEQWVRQADNRWLLTEYKDPAGEFSFASLGIAVKIADVYEKVQVEAE